MTQPKPLHYELPTKEIINALTQELGKPLSPKLVDDLRTFTARYFIDKEIDERPKYAGIQKNLNLVKKQAEAYAKCLGQRETYSRGELYCIGLQDSINPYDLLDRAKCDAETILRWSEAALNREKESPFFISPTTSKNRGE